MEEYLEKILAQSISLSLQKLLPMIPADVRTTASQVIADLVVRMYKSGGFEQFAKEELAKPVVEAPKMNLKASVKS